MDSAPEHMCYGHEMSTQGLCPGPQHRCMAVSSCDSCSRKAQWPFPQKWAYSHHSHFCCHVNKAHTWDVLLLGFSGTKGHCLPHTFSRQGLAGSLSQCVWDISVLMPDTPRAFPFLCGHLLPVLGITAVISLSCTPPSLIHSRWNLTMFTIPFLLLPSAQQCCFSNAFQCPAAYLLYPLGLVFLAPSSLLFVSPRENLLKTRSCILCLPSQAPFISRPQLSLLCSASKALHPVCPSSFPALDSKTASPFRV